MKPFYTFFIVLLLVGCSSSDDEEFVNNPTGGINDGGTTTMQLMGDFVNGAHPTMGKASVNAEHTILSFRNFKTDNGPVLNVYLFEELNSLDYVDLGMLQGLEGDFDYVIPANTDLSKYKKVSIWCVDFSVSFGHATLD